MVSQRNKKLVVIQLSGGNDCLDTVVPYNNGLYYDFRPTVHIAPDAVLRINDEFGFHPSMGAIKNLWDEGKVAIINGIGYPNPNRSHFRSLDIWHTAEPDKIGTEGWLGRVIRELDPKSENVLTGINFGRGLPRALGLRGVPVASVGNLDTYGLFPDLQDEALKNSALATFNKMYGGAAGRDVVLDYLGQTGADVLKGADVLRQAPAEYASSVSYPDNPVAHNLKAIAQVLLADIGTRIYYTTHASFDTHSGELPTHAQLWEHVDSSVGSFMEDLKAHNRLDDAVVFIFSEFGRRVKDNGSGSDHGSGGVAFVIGDSVHGGMYGEYPSLEEKDQLEGDLHFNNDFRSTYATLLEQWMGMESTPIVNGHFEQFDFLKPTAA